MHGSLEDHFLVIRIPWINKVVVVVDSIVSRVLNKFWSRRLKYKNRRREKRFVIVYSKFMTEK